MRCQNCKNKNPNLFIKKTRGYMCAICGNYPIKDAGDFSEINNYAEILVENL